MTQQFSKIKLVALNIDGVLLPDTFSPVMHQFVTSRGGRYTSDLERSIFSQPQIVAGANMASAARMTSSPKETMQAYFAEREAYLAEHSLTPCPGIGDLLQRIHDLGAEIVCYGGLDRTHFDRYLADHVASFDDPGYVHTNDIRPGVHEIATKFFPYQHDEAVFVDDVNRVAEFAKSLDTPFIGVPSHFEYSFQRQQMQETGVPHIVNDISQITSELLLTVDKEAHEGTFWGEAV